MHTHKKKLLKKFCFCFVLLGHVLHSRLKKKKLSPVLKSSCSSTKCRRKSRGLNAPPRHCSYKSEDIHPYQVSTCYVVWLGVPTMNEPPLWGMALCLGITPVPDWTVCCLLHGLSLGAILWCWLPSRAAWYESVTIGPLACCSLSKPFEHKATNPFLHLNIRTFSVIEPLFWSPQPSGTGK